KTLAFFRSLGLLTVTEASGRVYPFSDSANSIADVLRLHLEQRKNVQIITACEIAGLKKKNGVFTLTSPSQEYEAERVIVCAGGVAGGKLGGTELGYKLLASFGHKRTKLRPSLVQLRTDTTLVRSLKGIRCDARVQLNGKNWEGELQFTDYGVSGPVIFELSRAISSSKDSPELHIDLLRQYSAAELVTILQHRCASLPHLKAEDLLTGMLHNRLGRTMLRAAGVAHETLCGSLGLPELDAVAAKIKDFVLTVRGDMGMDCAQVTAGGVYTDDFNEKTMESKLCSGLYAAGEVLDIDGDCGGYNLQWAWSSGRLAG
ncbi:MAG: aminoacetone oxidase family FAD-binding enzyme, partial [Oscillospiraceae bacterium]|nr:aminoacetone oxidase family FAD-binding enzyme [Oscillospiraceae bacterium]